jgi:hypothetical protein
MAQKTVVLGAAAAQLARIAVRNRDLDYAKANEVFESVLSIVRSDAGVPQGIPAELAVNDENQIVLHFAEPDITPVATE